MRMGYPEAILLSIAFVASVWLVAKLMGVL